MSDERVASAEQVGEAYVEALAEHARRTAVLAEAFFLDTNETVWRVDHIAYWLTQHEISARAARKRYLGEDHVTSRVVRARQDIEEARKVAAELDTYVNRAIAYRIKTAADAYEAGYDDVVEAINGNLSVYGDRVRAELQRREEQRERLFDNAPPIQPELIYSTKGKLPACSTCMAEEGEAHDVWCSGTGTVVRDRTAVR